MTRAERRSRAETASLSLEEVPLGDRVRVVGVRYDDGCAAAGIQPGTELKCVDRHSGGTVVRTESGRSHTLPRSTASSISVARLEGRW